ncbi:MAG: prepilin-type N-terminal cleavage/methylation domain-containing protein [Candidatus Muiribacteriota bacterium]|jgi:prepilin-type N-terminal cleavage/methylation domain-containing protein
MKKQGFSLIEVMIAITILGTGLLFMYNMLGMGSRNQMKMQLTNQAYNLAVEGLEWMKSLDFLGDYYANRTAEGFFIMSAPTYDKKKAIADDDFQKLMWVNNGEPDESQAEGFAFLANFVGYYPYNTGYGIDTQEVPVIYDDEFFRWEGMGEFKRYGYYEMLDNSTVKLTCVVMWEELLFTSGRNPHRMEKISTVVVNNANVQH